MLNKIIRWLHSLEGTNKAQVFLMIWIIAPFGLGIVVAPICLLIYPPLVYFVSWLAGFVFFTMTILLFLWILTSDEPRQY